MFHSHICCMGELSDADIDKIKKEVSVKIGLKIRNIRQEKGLTQIQLADKIGSDRQYLYKIEKAKVGISVTKLAIIAKALDVPLTSLVDID